MRLLTSHLSSSLQGSGDCPSLKPCIAREFTWLLGVSAVLQAAASCLSHTGLPVSAL
jgi:hypothetical protein